LGKGAAGVLHGGDEAVDVKRANKARQRHLRGGDCLRGVSRVAVHAGRITAGGVFIIRRLFGDI